MRCPALAFALGLAVATSSSVSAEPCTTQQLTVFADSQIVDAVSRCKTMSTVGFELPPVANLTLTQQTQLCREPACKQLIGTVDDLEVPRCDATFNGLNVTLQTALDHFTAACDAATPVPTLKKHLASWASSASTSASGASGSGSYRRKRTMPEATTSGAAAPRALAVVVLSAVATALGTSAVGVQ